MSWSLDIGIIRKQDAVSRIMQLNPLHTVDEATLDQIYHAKKVALELVRGVPGPFVSVSMSGHANGVGWQGKEGRELVREYVAGERANVIGRDV